MAEKADAGVEKALASVGRYVSPRVHARARGEGEAMEPRDRGGGPVGRGRPLGGEARPPSSRRPATARSVTDGRVYDECSRADRKPERSRERLLVESGSDRGRASRPSSSDPRNAGQRRSAAGQPSSSRPTRSGPSSRLGSAGAAVPGNGGARSSASRGSRERAAIAASGAHPRSAPGTRSCRKADRRHLVCTAALTKRIAKLGFPCP